MKRGSAGRRPIVRKGGFTARESPKSRMPGLPTEREKPVGQRRRISVAVEHLLATAGARRWSVHSLRVGLAVARDSDRLRMARRPVRHQHSARVADVHARDDAQAARSPCAVETGGEEAGQDGSARRGRRGPADHRAPITRSGSHSTCARSAESDLRIDPASRDSAARRSRRWEVTPCRPCNWWPTGIRVR